MKKSMLLLAAFTMALLVFSLSREIPTSAQEEVDITVLIETADTPEDHLKIAEYYEEQAVMMEEALHESMAEATRKMGTPTHCEAGEGFKASAEQYRDGGRAQEMAQRRARVQSLSNGNLPGYGFSSSSTREVPRRGY
jgi:hypothetical protein